MDDIIQNVTMASYQDYAALWSAQSTHKLDDSDLTRMFSSLQQDLKAVQELEYQLQMTKQELDSYKQKNRISNMWTQPPNENDQEREEEKKLSVIDLQQENTLLQKQMIVQEKELRMLLEHLDIQSQKTDDLKHDLYRHKSTRISKQNRILQEENRRLEYEFDKLETLQRDICCIVSGDGEDESQEDEPPSLSNSKAQSIRNLKRKVDLLQKDNDAKRLEMEGLRQQLVSSREKQEESKQQKDIHLGQARSSLEAYKKNSSLLIGVTSSDEVEEILSFQLEIEQVCQELTAKTSQIKKLQDDLAHKEVLLQATFENLARQNEQDPDELRTKEKERQLELSVLRSRLEKRQIESQQYQTQATSLTTALEKTKELLDMETSAKETLATELEQFQVQVKKEERLNHKFQEEHALNLQSLTKELGAMERTIEGLQDERKAFLGQFETEHKRTNKRIHILEQSIKAKSRVIESLEKELDNQDPTMNRRKFKEDMKELKEDLKDAKQQSDDYEKETKRLQQEMETKQIDSAATIKTLEQRVEELQSNDILSHETIQNMEEGDLVPTLTMRLEKLQKQNQDLTTETTKLSLHLEQSAIKLKVADQREAEYEIMRKESLLLTQQLKELEKSFNQTIEDENKALKQQVQDLERALRQDRKATLTQQLNGEGKPKRASTMKKLLFSKKS
jgi:hypothetical protein